MIKGTLSGCLCGRFKRVALRPTSLRLSTMIVDVDRQTLSTIRNSDLRLYAVKYIDISEDFMAPVRSSGIEIDPDDYKQETATRIDRLRQRGGIFRSR